MTLTHRAERIAQVHGRRELWSQVLCDGIRQIAAKQNVLFFGDAVCCSLYSHDRFLRICDVIVQTFLKVNRFFLFPKCFVKICP